jgi:hypothetical protein
MAVEPVNCMMTTTDAATLMVSAESGSLADKPIQGLSEQTSATAIPTLTRVSYT